MKNTQIRILGQENMHEKPSAHRGTPEDALGSVTVTDKELEAAALQVCGNATNAAEAKETLEMLGYISYPHAEHYYKTSGQIKPAEQRYKKNAMSPTNGWIERKALANG